MWSYFLKNIRQQRIVFKKCVSLPYVEYKLKITVEYSEYKVHIR